MTFMKTKFLAVLAVAAMLGSCSDDDNNGVNQQSHDDSEMMARMHAMMTDMNAMAMTNDPDLDFANMMIMHHQGAIAMANLELESGDNSTMRATAQEIITAQQQEIQDFQQILQGMSDNEDDMSFSMELMMSMDKMDTTADTQLITGNVDRDFATLMMVHHQAALDNASAYLHHGTNPELLAMANMIVDVQTEEIIELGNWLLNN